MKFILCCVVAVLFTLAVSVLCDVTKANPKQATLFSSFNKETIYGRIEFFASRVPIQTTNMVNIFGNFNSTQGTIAVCLVTEEDYPYYVDNRDYKTCIKMTTNTKQQPEGTFNWAVKNQAMRLVFTNTALHGEVVFSASGYVEPRK